MVETFLLDGFADGGRCAESATWCQDSTAIVEWTDGGPAFQPDIYDGWLGFNIDAYSGDMRCLQVDLILRHHIAQTSLYVLCKTMRLIYRYRIFMKHRFGTKQPQKFT